MLSPLHILTWDKATSPKGSPRSHILQVQELLDAGADWIQLRQKNGSEKEKAKTAIEAVKLCRRYNSVIIINDSPQICAESGADGVHLGLNDCSAAEARVMLASKIIGGTANTQLQAKQRVTENCDYIGLGPYRFTATKNNLSEVLGESGIKKIADLRLPIPIIAIGGITPQDVPKILSLGVQGIAVSSAVVSAPSIKKAFAEFKSRFTN